MRGTRAGSVLPFVYFLLVSAVALSLGAFGYLLDRLPLVPASASLAYQRGLVACIAGLSRPIDGWVDVPRDAPVGEPTVESSP